MQFFSLTISMWFHISIVRHRSYSSALKNKKGVEPKAQFC